MRFIAALAIGCFLAPAPAGPLQDDGVLHIGGSTTLLPAITACASAFMEKYETWDKADPALPKKNIVIYVTGGGSSFGVKSTINQTFHVGLVSRDLKKEEQEKLGEHETFLAGKDCVAIAVNKQNPLVDKKDNFTKAELAKLFSGEVSRYRQISPDAADREIVLLVRDASAGSSEIVQKMILGDRKFSPNALQIPSQGALLRKLESNSGALAYISAGMVHQSDQLKAFAVEGVEPTTKNVLSGTYPLVRPLLLVVKGKPSPMLRKFIDYVLGDGQKMIKEQGFVTVREVE